MAADGGLSRLLEKPLPENPTLLEALSDPNKPIDPASFTEIFSELHFQEKQSVLPSLAPRPPPRAASWLALDAAADWSLDALLRPKPASTGVSTVKRSANFCTRKSSASLLLSTEGLGSESTVDADDMLKDCDAEAEAAAARIEDMAETTEDAERGGGAGVEEAEEENAGV